MRTNKMIVPATQKWQASVGSSKMQAAEWSHGLNTTNFASC